MIVRIRIITAVLLLMPLIVAGCKGDKIFGAAKDFIAFSEGDDRVIDPLSHASGDFQIRRWKGNHLGTRFRALVDIEINSSMDARKLHKVLADAIHAPSILREASVVMVRAWPGKLEKLAAPMGIGIFARDGHGWEGNSVEFEKIFVFQPTPEQSKEKGIQPLSEAEYLRLLGVENAMKRGKDLNAAQKQVAEFQSIPLSRVLAACQHAAILAKWYHSRKNQTGLPVSLDSPK